jgi:NAD(P)-dependent dehydrogenase (short-subunit alcohol dehydrogenase family)
VRTTEDTLALVTGATDGIGRETALQLSREGARVIVHGRDPAKVERVQAEVAAVRRGGAGPALSGWVCDFSSLAQIRAGAADLLARTPVLHVLVNNAGVYQASRTLTVDGFETTFAINHLAPFLLTHLLAPALAKGAPARVVNVSSGLHGSGRLDLADLASAKGYSGQAAYAMSKLCNLLFTQELAARRDPRQLATNALHPGVVSTKLLQAAFNMEGHQSLSQGALTSVMLALSPELEGVTGRYYSLGREARPSRSANDAEGQKRLWTESLRLCGLEEA